MVKNKKHKKNNSMLIQGSILAAASLIVRIIGLLYRIPMTNIIGDEGMGYYNTAFEIYNIALILSSFSLPLAVSKLVATRGINKQYKNAYRIFKCAMIFAVIVGTTASLILYFGANFLSTNIFKSPRSVIPLKVLAPTIAVFSIMGVLRGYYQGKNTMLPTSVSQILEQIVNAIVSVFCAYFFMKRHSASDNIAAYGAAGGTTGTLVGAIVALIFLLFIYQLYRPIIKRQIRNDKSLRVESYKRTYILLIATIIPVILSQTVYQLSGVLDNFMFGQIMSAKGYSEEMRSSLLGIYSGKYRLLTNVPVSLSSAFATAMIPNVVGAIASGNLQGAKYKVQSVIKLNMIIAFPSAVGMGVLASPILKLIFKDERDLPANLLMIGSVAIVFFSLSTVTNAVLQAINKMILPVIHSAISLLIHVVLLFILLKFTNLGTYALVIGNITFPLVVCILNWLSIQKYLDYRQEIIRTFMIPCLCSGIMGVIAFVTYKVIYNASKINLVAIVPAIFIAIIIYFAFMIIFKGIVEKEILSMPKGKVIVKILKKFHFL